MLSKKKNFTLVELMIIIVVIGILVAVALPRFNSFIEEGKVQATLQEMDAIKNASKMYKMNTREYPMTTEDLITDPIVAGRATGPWNAKYEKWDGPYMDADAEDVGSDSWGNSYKLGYYKVAGKYGIIIMSPGSDEIDDISGGAQNDDIAKYIRFDGTNDLSAQKLINGGAYTAISVNGLNIK